MWVLSEVCLAVLFLGSHKFSLVWDHQGEATFAHFGGLKALLGANANLWCQENFHVGLGPLISFELVFDYWVKAFLRQKALASNGNLPACSSKGRLFAAECTWNASWNPYCVLI